MSEGAGRPGLFTQDIADAICVRLADGESLRSICLDEAMPAKSTVLLWLTKPEYSAFLDQYTRAREVQADSLVDEIPDIADDGSNDWMERRDAEGGNVGWRENGEAIGRSRLRIDARKWLAGQMKPKVYGERKSVELTGKDGGPIQTEQVANDADAFRRRLLSGAIAGTAASGTGEADTGSAG